ncbi:Elongation factor G [Gemmata sp. SH-PL17]|uniref:elongation factor G n=1 Tax=Gemmata sp. SH-PL17 TaxID=1630693 RepID=UPI0004B9ADAE|nr:TetM/TetW/TetO/TetS family tetracycline resistance ribosomal protection protein [Gemmata sp. SH-PL17]AMV24654.1 Elongation factor G [Gemmata sp. SH-PL17]
MAKNTGVDLTRVRNLGVIAHIDAGKTTTTEHLLYYAGAKHKLGGVDEGTTDTDYDPEEQARGITIYSACVPFEWAGHTINLIDTPGHVDFTAEVERSLRVLDGAVVVFDGQKGVEAQSETVWRQANRYGVPRMVFVNKMDVVGANFARTLESVRSRLTPNPEEQGRPVPIIIPIGSGGAADSRTPFGGVIDLIEMKAKFFDAGDFGKTVRIADIPEENLAEAQEYREQLLDAITDHDEKDLVATAALKDLITSARLEGTEADPAKLRQLVREQCLARKIYPVLAGSGREHIGIQPLLDAVTFYLPSPLDRPAVVGTDAKGKEQKRKPDPKEPFCGLVFKASWHPNGNRFFIRVYSGVMKPNMRAYNPGKDTKENVAKLFHVHADPARGLEEVENGPAGDIVCVVGLKDTVTGDTLCETAHPILLETITFAEAVVSQSIEPESGADKDKLAHALEVLQLEDPTFKLKVSEGQTVMSGMGTLHLEVKRHRLERDFRLKVRAYPPRVSFREMLKAPRTVDVKVEKLGDKPAFAELKVSFTNFKTDKPVSVFNVVNTDANPVPVAFLAAAEKALFDSLQTGELGYPMMNAQARLLDAKFDPQVSTEDAFVAAAIRAYREATQDNVQLLEPIMKVTVTTPNQFVGSILGDLTRRGGQIDAQEMSPNGDMVELISRVPLRELFTYANEVRSLSQGRAAMGMEPHSYEPAPDSVLRQLMGE